ncbi:metal-dependent hydrolase [Natronorubrum sulfidifaciens]|uniref:Membrane-bound metal-dependent hydrolase n=1 Tax=Natronorubrum sulfidifaciens JCM 14089 TaxID=1230460 RepID=L9VXX0_9EURY|nr:metal-dependent hydrolase [Natronorubrum sulfidifaciens]ELY42020.1 membrane-bound metal-dependent hydrolase [Natronorubrum sulfidifaciens JCM 14089]
MYQLGHFGASLLAYAPLGTVVALGGHETAAVVGAVVCLSLSTLPDCDQRLPAIEHRGPTHSIVFALLVGLGLAATTALFVETSAPATALGATTFAFVVGMLSISSHLLADVLTPMGIRPFWPLSSRHYTREITPAANPRANYVLLGVGVGSILAAAAVVVAFG